MLTELRLKNFKCFQEELTAPFSKINLLTGVNGRGKSTVLQALLCMRQSIERSITTDRIFFNGSCVNLGTFSDVRNSATPREEPVLAAYEFSGPNGYIDLSYAFSGIEEDPLAASVTTVSAVGEIGGQTFSVAIRNNRGRAVFTDGAVEREAPFWGLFVDPAGLSETFKAAAQLGNFARIHYVSADRIGPRDYYPRESAVQFSSIGQKGEGTVDLLFRRKDDSVASPLRLPEAESSTVLDQANAWIKYIFAGGNLSLKLLEEANLVAMGLNSDGSQRYYRPVNTGFGYSYVLPTVVSALISKPGDFLIVENPEAHIHPMAQARIAEMLARLSCSGVQVFIESHSEHILNGIRIARAKNMISSEDANVLYFQSGESAPLLKVPILEKGKIENWPHGFFDQSELDFQRLHGF